MKPPRLDDSLMLLYDKAQGNKPRGTGFFVSDSGHFVTAYHVVYSRPNVDVKRDLRCRWNGETYRILFEPRLANFYQSEKVPEWRRRNDLTILKADMTNESLRTIPVPTTPFDFNNSDLEWQDVRFKGFCTQDVDSAEGVRQPLALKASLARYEPENGTWLVQEKRGPIPEGLSGSPVLNLQTGEVMGVVVQQSRASRGIDVIQSLHMLADALRACKCDVDTWFPLSNMYREYVDRCNCRFELEAWPLAITKEDFVDAFDFCTFRLDGRAEERKQHANAKCVPFAVGKLKEHPVFCVGYYGMGKTTVAKFLFTRYAGTTDVHYPIFASLDQQLPANLDELTDFLVGKIWGDFHDDRLQGKFPPRDYGLVREYFRAFLSARRPALIFDAIDEAICDRQSLRKFARLLVSLPCSYFLTSRQEFHAFFDVFKEVLNGHAHTVIKLMPWGREQWQTYVQNLQRGFPDKLRSIKRLDTGLKAARYGSLPERPLFLRMISDLELGNETGLEIPARLRSNKARIYWEYVRWKIGNDFVRKGQLIQHLGIREDSFRRDCFRLFEELAAIEYERSVPAAGAIDLIRADHERVDAYDHSAFTLEDIRATCVARHFDTIDADFAREHFQGSTLFSTIRMEKKAAGPDLFRFSHKSFCEYLVAFDLADSVLPTNVGQAECGETWNLYQTHEVSNLFEEEVARICFERSFSKQERNQYLRNAFEKVLLAGADFAHYAERVEEVLYYAGRFKVRSPQILRTLELITREPQNVQPVYYRTAHIALAFAKSRNYCMKYVEYLIDSYQGNRDAFELNTRIQNYYYGQRNLHAVLQTDIDGFIENGKLGDIMALKVFSYFTCLPFGPDEIEPARRYLSEVKEVCDRKGYSRMSTILEKTAVIMEEMSRTVTK